MNRFQEMFKNFQKFLMDIGQQIMILALILGVIGFIVFELIFLEPINLNNSFIIFLILGLIWLFLMTLPLGGKAKNNSAAFDAEDHKKGKTKLFITLFMFLLVGVLFLTNFFTTRLFMSKNYANLIGDIQQVEFTDIYSDDNKIESSYIDKNAALVAAEKKIGELADLSSIYTVDVDNFSKIKYNGKLVRVAPLKHINYNYRLRENNKGIPYYVMVDVSDNKTSAKAELINIEDNPIKYSPNALFFKSVNRAAFLHNPTYTYGRPTFELDEGGVPYFSIPILGHRFLGVNGEYLNKVLLVNASTGETKEYDNNSVPEWVDRVYPTNLMLNQAADHYKLKNGFWGTQDMIWSNRVGLKTIDTEIDTYNYITINDDIYIFTGVRPLDGEGSSTTSMLYMNIKTGEIKELNKSGISLSAAKTAATESVIEKGYTPTTPNLLSIDNNPTYVMTLKSDSGTSYGFSMVNYEDLNLNAFGNSLFEVRKNYLTVMSGNGGVSSDLDLEGSHVIDEIKMVTVEGNSQYYIKFNDNNNVYIVDVTINSFLPFMQSGDEVSVTSQGSSINFIQLSDEVEE